MSNTIQAMTHDAAKRNRPSVSQARTPAGDTSWEQVADWYEALAADKGTEFHQNVIVPGLMKLLGLRPGERVCDLACGQGAVTSALARTGAVITGVDLSPTLIALARTRAAAGTTYVVGDARNVPELKSGSFDAVTCILAAMNIDPVEPLFAEIARLLRGPGPGNRSGGRAVIVILHPAFRVPRQSRWKWDEGRKLLLREVDRYLGPLKIPIDLRPFNRPGEAVTATYHRPAETYLNGLAKVGLWTDAYEEWPSHRTSQPGPKAKAENRARDEFPLFLAVRANKVSFRRWA